jgi:hypothetical protein
MVRQKWTVRGRGAVVGDDYFNIFALFVRKTNK